MKGFCFTAGDEYFTVDVTLVQKVLRNISYTPVPAVPEAIVGITNFKGGIVTLIDLINLLGQKRNDYATDAIIFKSSVNGNNQMGLTINKPGELIDIDVKKILPPPVTTGDKQNFCVSGMIGVDGVMYRIVDINSIINKLRQQSEKIANTKKQGEIDNEELT